MPFDVLAAARDWSLILLVLEAFVVALIPLLILYQLTKALRGFLPKMVPALRQLRERLLNVMARIQRALRAFSAPFIWMNSTAAGINAFIARARRLLPGRR